MSYEKYYSGGWQSGETGGTPITPAALNHMEQGIANLDSEKAPAGYGLGKGAPVMEESEDLNDVFGNGFFHWGTAPTHAPFDWGYMINIQSYGEGSAQIAFSITDGNITVIRKKVDNVWGEWEYVNHPLIPGVEYRTTERWNGKPVYASLTKISGLPNNAYGSYGLVSTYCDNVIRHHISYERSDDASFLGLPEAGQVYIGNYGDPYVVFNQTQSDMSTMTAYVTLFYTKTTD